ncbi:phage tail tape measure protein [Brevundimonas sp. SL130]|uniref:phage tail tape measure protein n=1 Tax=Brevundimonas sp. SL130 TaxID=2995143 RepID=UPI00226C8E55|nr:phage tail tape measure protein [Brevundimonas sp. SL130]WAC59419.1 phage tail tape measure protein [Brevundimonas sp. SL130]
MADEFGRKAVDDLPLKAAEAGAALEALKGPAEDAANAIEAAFGRAGDSLTRSLARAAADGEVSLGELAKAVLNAVNAAAGSGGSGNGLSAAIQAAMSSFGGARADGGPVMGGAAYLVGERGPEVFRPATGGEIGPSASGGVTVNVAVDGGAPALLRSEAQIAQMLARAVSLGARRM